MQQTKVSASQIGVWKDCQRRWGYEYVDGLRPPPNASAELGSKVHSILEGYVTKGEEPPSSKAGRIAARGLDFAKTLRDRGAKVEHKFDFEFGGVVYGGFVDAHHFEDGELLIVDWKTSSDPAKWGLTDDTLPTNTQAVVYAMWGVTEYPVDRVHLHWHYLDTRSSQLAKPAQAILDKSYIAKAFAELAHAPACEISKARKKAAVDLPQNFASCGKYGGCPHIERCHGSATPAERLKSLMSQALRAPGHIPNALTAPTKEGSRMSLLSMLEDEETTSSAPANDPAPETKPEPVEASTPPEPAPTPEGEAAQAAAYEAAGQRLPPKRGRGRPRGAKNKPKEWKEETESKRTPAEGAKEDADVKPEVVEGEKSPYRDEGPNPPYVNCWAHRPELDVEERAALRKVILEKIEHATDGSDALAWAQTYDHMK